MPFTSRRIWLLITALFAAGIVSLTFWQVIAAHFHAIPGINGDAGKNIFTLIYHSLFGHGQQFTGMNYPYGDHILYADAQPLLSVTLGYLGCNNMGTAMALMWSLLLSGYFLAIIFTYRTLLFFNVPPPFSTFVSGLIVVMSPQLYRATGHFGLSYACIVPMLFYWTCRYHNARHWRYPAFILLLGLVANMLHPYQSAITLAWVALYCLGYVLFTNTTIPTRLRHILPLAISITLLFATLTILIGSTDHVKDRPHTPYGLTVYCTQGIDIFTSYYSPVWAHLDGEKGDIQKNAANEGAAYPGIVVLCIIICSLLYAIILIRKRKKDGALTNAYAFPPVYLFMAFMSMLLAMGVPFVWNMEWLIRYLSFMRQFRTLGRFAWIFYYIMTVYGAVTLYRWYSQSLLLKGKAVAYGMCALLLAVWSYEASGYILSMNRNMEHSSENFALLSNKAGNGWPQFLAAHQHSAADFQAILMLPFFNVGTDKLWVGNDASQAQIGDGTIAGIQLHLPWVNAMMARSSWSMAQQQVKIAAGCYADKPMLRQLTSTKPFLLIHQSGIALSDDQAYLLHASDTIGTYGSCAVYACYPQRIQANDSMARTGIAALAATLHPGTDSCIGCGAATWYADHFDTGKASQHFFGSGARLQIMQMETKLMTIPIRPAAHDQSYEFSCWFLLGDSNYRSPFFKLDMLDASGNLIGSQDIMTKESTDSKGLWFRTSAFFTIPTGCMAIKCRLRNEPDNSYIAMDELLLRPAGAVVIVKPRSGKSILVNNHLLQ